MCWQTLFLFPGDIGCTCMHARVSGVCPCFRRSVQCSFRCDLGPDCLVGNQHPISHCMHLLCCYFARLTNLTDLDDADLQTWGCVHDELDCALPTFVAERVRGICGHVGTRADTCSGACRGSANLCFTGRRSRCWFELGCKRCCICWNATWTQEPRTVTGRIILQADGVCQRSR